MPIADADLKFYRGSTVSDGASNGGRMSATQVVSGAAANLFAAVGQAERTAGSTKYRKLFAKVANDDDLTLYEGKVFIDQTTPGDDAITFLAGDQVNTQSDLTGSEKEYGAGFLAESVSDGAVEIEVLWESAAAAPEDGDLLRITDKADLSSAGNEEYVRIDGAVVGSGVAFTIPLAAPLQNGYSASSARVAGVYEAGDVEASAGHLEVTSTAGTFDGDSLLLDNIGTVEQLWTLTFTSGTAFNIVGDTLGAVGSGNISGGASPNNPSFSKPYFVLQAAGFGGTFLSGDVIVFETHPASVALWVKRVVPAGADPIASNSAVVALQGETAG